MNGNQNTTYPNFWDSSKLKQYFIPGIQGLYTILNSMGKFISLNAYIGKEEESQMIDFSFHLKRLRIRN